MADSKLVTKFLPAYTGNYTKNRAAQGGRITEITVHHCAGVMTVESLGALWQRVGRQGSSHYGVCGDAVGQYVAESDVAWTNSNWAANCRAVTIEVSNSGGAPDWPVSDASLQTLAKLVADIARRNGLGELCVGKNLTYHSMYTATACPGPYLLAKLPDIAAQANAINAEAQQAAAGTAGTETAQAAVQALAKSAVTLAIGPASSGDRKALRALAESLCLGYAEDETGCMRIGPASAGDQSTVLTKAAALGLAYGIYEPDAQSAQDGPQTDTDAKRAAARIAHLLAGLEELSAQLADAQECTKQAETALELELERAKQAGAVLEQARQRAQQAETALAQAQTYAQDLLQTCAA